MSMTDQSRTDRLWGLPHPDTHGEFYADVPTKRFLAWLVDSVLILLLTLLAIPLTAFTGLFFFPFLWLTVSAVYRIASLSRSSATPGMRLMAIEIRNGRVVRLDLVMPMDRPGRLGFDQSPKFFCGRQSIA